MSISHYVCDNCGDPFCEYADGSTYCSCGRVFCSEDCADSESCKVIDEQDIEIGVSPSLIGELACKACCKWVEGE